MARRGFTRGLMIGGAAIGSLALINARIARDSIRLQRHSTDPSFRATWWRHGMVDYRVLGRGRPLLLLHGIHAAASAYEMRHQVRSLAGRFRVYAPDLLGFGYSDRPPIAYRGSTFVALIGDLVRHIISEPTDVIASSLTAAYAIENAARYPDLIRKLILVCPGGVGAQSSPPGPMGDAIHALLRSPVVGTALFNALTSRASLRYFLAEKCFFDPHYVTDEMVETHWQMAHQPGGQWAPAAFLSQRLHRDVRQAWQALTQPVLIVWGGQAQFTPVENVQHFLHLRPNTDVQIFDRCGILPHDEHAHRFNTLVQNYLD